MRFKIIKLILAKLNFDDRHNLNGDKVNIIKFIMVLLFPSGF